MRDTALELADEDSDGDPMPELEAIDLDEKNDSANFVAVGPQYRLADGSAVLEVRGRLVAPALALRVLRRYLQPAAVAEREAARQLDRGRAWAFLPAHEAERMVTFRECTLCEERHWCVNMDPPSPRGYCEECFNEMFGNEED